MEYCTNGVMAKTSTATGIPETTLAHWKNKSEWWDELLVEVRSEINQSILAQNLQIATKAGERVLDSLENGDEKLVWDKDKGEHVIVRVKPTGKEAVIMSGVSQDKARVQLNLPTSITSKTSSMEALAKQFIELAQRNARVVSVQQPTKTNNTEQRDID